MKDPLRPDRRHGGLNLAAISEIDLMAVDVMLDARQPSRSSRRARLAPTKPPAPVTSARVMV
jgi:hypothetical protein